MITLDKFNLFGIQQAFNRLWNTIKSLYPATQIAGGYIGSDGTVYSSFGLRAVDPVSRISDGLYHIYLDQEVSYQTTVILVSPIINDPYLRTTGYSLAADPSAQLIVATYGQDAFDEAITQRDSVFQFFVWKIR